ncbi:uncharacterized protein ACN2A1_002046 [Glossina fuscipes fuscipes]
MRKNKMEKNIKITNKKQFKAMVEWMKQHPDIAKGKGPYGPNKCQLKEKMEELAFEINAYGPPIRLPEEWLRICISIPSHTLAKMSKLQLKFIRMLNLCGNRFCELAAVKVEFEKSLGTLLCLKKVIHVNSAIFAIIKFLNFFYFTS